MDHSGNEISIFKINKNKKLDKEIEISQKGKEFINKTFEILSKYGFGSTLLIKLSYDTPPMRALGAELDNKEGFNQKLDFSTVL